MAPGARGISPCGGLASVCVGDRPQCQALFDQQIYDIEPHSKTQTHPLRQDVRLSHQGLEIYRAIDNAIILSEVHRVIKHTENDCVLLSDDQQPYNTRPDRFLEVLHCVRDLSLTTEDYY